MPFPIDSTRCLAFAPADTPLEVCTIPSDALRAQLALDGFFERDEITCLPNASGRVTVRLADGRQIAIERRYAVVIEVAPSRRTRQLGTTRANVVRPRQRALAV